ncbi:hypothetical protein N0V83_010836 [Neocucurbitaria cava]|uniref:Uncharacterized protein n=1 Tax=Neocucurbitaria cava TaxID=798079 RepID=A0A9W8XYW3_9PLEO|nr:hypothetical protein N0V83_010836 [Neocucurbitaria cava]
MAGRGRQGHPNTFQRLRDENRELRADNTQLRIELNEFKARWQDVPLLEEIAEDNKQLRIKLKAAEEETAKVHQSTLYQVSTENIRLQKELGTACSRISKLQSRQKVSTQLFSWVKKQLPDSTATTTINSLLEQLNEARQHTTELEEELALLRMNLYEAFLFNNRDIAIEWATAYDKATQEVEMGVEKLAQLSKARANEHKLVDKAQEILEKALAQSRGAIQACKDCLENQGAEQAVEQLLSDSKIQEQVAEKFEKLAGVFTGQVRDYEDRIHQLTRDVDEGCLASKPYWINVGFDLGRQQQHKHSLLQGYTMRVAEEERKAAPYACWEQIEEMAQSTYKATQEKIVHPNATPSMKLDRENVERRALEQKVEQKVEQRYLNAAKTATYRAYHAGMYANACRCKATANPGYNVPESSDWHPLKMLEEMARFHVQQAPETGSVGPHARYSSLVDMTLSTSLQYIGGPFQLDYLDGSVALPKEYFSTLVHRIAELRECDRTDTLAQERVRRIRQIRPTFAKSTHSLLHPDDQA